jgi:hypothetical protein
MKAWNDATTTWYMAIGFVTLAFGAIWVIKRLWENPRIPPDVRRAMEDDAQRAAYEASPKCVCGELAVEPMPTLSRSRGASNYIREWFAMPPRYRRVVSPIAPASLCASHAHVADAMLDHFIHHRVRAVISEASAKVAVEAAGFEQEVLLQKIRDSLTDRQKRTTRSSMTPVRVLPHTGTDVGTDS